MESEHEPTDQQLDELLQYVAVPQDLKALLKQIPSQSQTGSNELGNGNRQMSASDATEQLIQRTESTEQQATTKSKAWLGLIIAASLIGIGLFVASHYLPDRNGEEPSIAKSKDENAENEIKTTKPGTGLAVAKSNSSEARLLELERRDLEVQSLEAQIHAIETAQLKASLIRAEQASSFTTDQNEVESLIAAMSEEYSIPLGMPEAKVKLGMAQVIQKFPGTQGASIAQSYLEQTQNN